MTADPNLERVSATSILASVPYFADLPPELLDRVANSCGEADYPAGHVLIEEGTPGDEMYVIVEGDLVVTSSRFGSEVELARLGPGEIVGEGSLLDPLLPRAATVTAMTPVRLLCISRGAFEELLADPRVARRMFRTAVSRLRTTEEALRHSERMAALGRMAAQLLHELNNPAAAVVRSASELRGIHNSLLELVLTRSGVVLTGGKAPANALERADAEEQVALWLERHGVPDPWETAPALVADGISIADLDQIPNDDDLVATVRFLGVAASAGQLLSEISMATGRISELVRVVKEYSYVDQAPIQDLVVTEGIEDTLVLLRHKLGDIEVRRDYQADLHPVTVPGRELNQVWMNLIDNSADAMPDGGVLEITAVNDGDAVLVRIADSGTGIPAELLPRIFDPFLTTKEPGQGTGLGLHIVDTIIRRLGGSVTVESDGSGTAFEVRIPLGD